MENVEMFNVMLIVLWLAIVIFCFVVEINTLDLTMIWFAAGALVALVVSFIYPGEFLVQALTFAVSSVLFIAVARPISKKHLKFELHKTNTDAMIGQHVKVTKQISEFERGEVYIDGKYWSAIAIDNQTYTVETRVEITAIQGNKVVVRGVN